MKWLKAMIYDDCASLSNQDSMLPKASTDLRSLSVVELMESATSNSSRWRTRLEHVRLLVIIINYRGMTTCDKMLSCSRCSTQSMHGFAKTHTQTEGRSVFELISAFRFATKLVLVVSCRSSLCPFRLFVRSSRMGRRHLSNWHMAGAEFSKCTWKVPPKWLVNDNVSSQAERCVCIESSSLYYSFNIIL